MAWLEISNVDLCVKSGVCGVSHVCNAGRESGQAVRGTAGDAVEGAEAEAEEGAAEQAGPQPVAGVQPGTDMLGDVKTFQVLWHAASASFYACACLQSASSLHWNSINFSRHS